MEVVWELRGGGEEGRLAGGLEEKGSEAIC